MAYGRITNTVALKKIMVERSLDKISELSRASGVSRTTLGTVLSGKSQPSAEVMNKLVSALRIPPALAGEIFFANDLRTA